MKKAEKNAMRIQFQAALTLLKQPTVTRMNDDIRLLDTREKKLIADLKEIAKPSIVALNTDIKKKGTIGDAAEANLIVVKENLDRNIEGIKGDFKQQKKSRMLPKHFANRFVTVISYVMAMAV